MINSKEIERSKQEIAGLLKLKVERPWGYFRQFCQNEPVTVKIIVVNPQEQLSLQSHGQRSEFWRVVSGSGKAVIGNQLQNIVIGDELIIPVGTKHRLIAGADGLEILEIAFGEFKENDIIRYEDKYGRI
jgi:mannose-6-phosphate isomerase-like protein (cupin superfamily)